MVYGLSPGNLQFFLLFSRKQETRQKEKDRKQSLFFVCFEIFKVKTYLGPQKHPFKLLKSLLPSFVYLDSNQSFSSPKQVLTKKLSSKIETSQKQALFSLVYIFTNYWFKSKQRTLPLYKSLKIEISFYSFLTSKRESL